MRFFKRDLITLGLGLLCHQTALADWPMLRGEATHRGFVSGELRRPFRLVWAREIEGERLGTAMEPIVSKGRIFVATHAGNLYALGDDSGEALWRFQASGPFLHSPAVAGGLVIAGNADGGLYALDAANGKLVWKTFAAYGGFSASPTVEQGTIYIGTRAGEFMAVAIGDGKVVWSQPLGFPIRQTAAVAGGKVFVTAEDLRVRCFEAASGRILWTSGQLWGQTARDYYPVVASRNGRTYVLVRTNPILNMGQRIGRDRGFLCRNAGVDDSNWQRLDSWIKSGQGRGSADLWAKEGEVISQYLVDNPDARSLFILDGRNGKETAPAPVLWVGGCQGSGPQPAVTADERLLVFYRSAYGNWNHGVAPLVALGLWDVETNHVVPLFHQQGPQPNWNCFWGTADESQNFLVVGDTVMIIHQGTLSGFDLKKQELFPIWGERDTFGGFRNPPWARNEWHGPGRGGVAVVGHRIYWQTGSRILCLAAGEASRRGDLPGPSAIAKINPASVAPAQHGLSREAIRQQLNRTAEALLTCSWAPLFTDPGLAGRVFLFDNSGDFFEALAWAYPHLAPGLRAEARTRLRAEWTRHPPFTLGAAYSLGEGSPREWCSIPAEYRGRLGNDKQPHPFGNIHRVGLFADRCGEEALVLESWPRLKEAYEDFARTGWRLDPVAGDPFANRYLASLLALVRLAEKAGDRALALKAKLKADETTRALVAWWERAASEGTLRTFNASAELDSFIGKGDGLFFALAPHRHKLALFQDLTPEVATLVLAQNRHSVEEVWRTFAGLCPTWALVGEERQIHFGENFVDPPDFALSAFRAFNWLCSPSYEALSSKVDLPSGRADPAYLFKLALALERKD